MAQLLALLQNDPALLRCQLRRLDRAVDLGAARGKVVGAGYFENGKVLLRKRPASGPVTLEDLASDVKSEMLLAASHGQGPGGFREEDTEPYRLRNWLFAGTGKILPLGERQKIIDELPDFLMRGLVGPSEAELAFLTTLGHIHQQTRLLDNLDVDVETVGRALAKTLEELDQKARESRVAVPQTTAMISNGRVVAAVRRGRPLSYALLEGLSECPVCGIDRSTKDDDPRVRPHRTLKAVVLASRGKADGVQWIDVPENHLVTISRNLEIKLVPL